MSQDRYPPLPPLSPQDRAYAAIVVTQPWQPVPQIQTQEANAARVAALEAEITRLQREVTAVTEERHIFYMEIQRLQAGLPGLRIEHDGRIACAVDSGRACDCGADDHNARIDALLCGEAAR